MDLCLQSHPRCTLEQILSGAVYARCAHADRCNGALRHISKWAVNRLVDLDGSVLHRPFSLVDYRLQRSSTGYAIFLAMMPLVLV